MPKLLLKPPVLAGLASVAIAVICFLFLLERNVRQLSQKGFANEGKLVLLPNLVVYKTSARIFSLSDAEGFSLLPGYLVCLFVGENGDLFAGYVPVDYRDDDLPELKNIPLSDMQWSHGKADSKGDFIQPLHEIKIERVPVSKMQYVDLMFRDQ